MAFRCNLREIPRERLQNFQGFDPDILMNIHDCIRFGCHRFLNSRPFADYLFEHQRELCLDIRCDTPASLADALKTGALDLAVIPSIEYLRIPGARIIPDFSIASNGSVKTVLLVCGKTLNKVETIAIDQRSRSSVVLLKLFLRDKGVGPVALSTLSPDVSSMLAKHDAALIIGDAAFHAPALGIETYDLGSEWFRMTGQHFVHALMAASPNASINPRLLRGIQEAKKEGRQKTEQIAREESRRLGVPLKDCRDYLRNKIIYDLGPEEMSGLRQFYKMAIDNGLAPSSPGALRFVE